MKQEAFNMPEKAPSPEFRTTHWSVVLAAGDQHSPQAEQCLATLCQQYWYPVYCFVRKRRLDPHQAKDLTQDFFAWFLEKNHPAKADPERGRFRSFLMTSVENFLRSDYQRQRALKRGGGKPILSLDLEAAEQDCQHALREDRTPAWIYDLEWARTVLKRVLECLQQESVAAGRGALFEGITPHLWGDADSIPYAALATQLGITETNVKVSAHRLRLRFREILRREVAQTLSSPDEVEEEIRCLMKAVSG